MGIEDRAYMHEDRARRAAGVEPEAAAWRQPPRRPRPPFVTQTRLKPSEQPLHAATWFLLGLVAGVMLGVWLYKVGHGLH